MNTKNTSPETISDADLDDVQGAGAKWEQGKGIVLSSETHEPTKGVILSSEGSEPSKGVILSSEGVEPGVVLGH